MKVLFVFGSSISLEVFAESGFLELENELLGDIEIEVAIRRNHFSKSPQKEQLNTHRLKLHEYSGEKRQEKIFKWMLNFEFINKRQDSIPFSRRIGRKLFGNYQQNQIGFTKYLNFFRVNINNKDNLFLMAAYLPLISKFFRLFLKKIYRYPKSFESICQKTSPDLIILMSNGAEPSLYEIPLVSRKNGIQWHLIVDNWDNLSSKTVFWFKPDHIYVWGKHHTDFARGFHKIEPRAISEIGTPRISFPKMIDRNITRRNLILYAGMQMPYDEISDLEAILNFCESGDFELIYRPHPLRKFSSTEKDKLTVLAGSRVFHVNKPENFSHYRSSSLPNLEMQTNFSNMKKESLLAIRFYCVIATPTSLALEALIYQNPLIMIARDDEIHTTSASSYWDLYPHMEPLKKKNEIRVARSHSELVDILSDSNESTFKESTLKVIQREICKSGREDWAINLLTAIRKSMSMPAEKKR